MSHFTGLVFCQCGSKCYGVKSENKKGTYRYYVCAEAQGTLPEGFVALEIPRGRFAKATVRGGPEAIEAAYLSIARGLAEQGGPGEGYGYELYEASRQAVTPPYDRFDYDVFRPVRAG
jgi:predicted transcriptional regulator YdeE